MPHSLEIQPAFHMHITHESVKEAFLYIEKSKESVSDRGDVLVLTCLLRQCSMGRLPLLFNIEGTLGNGSSSA